MAKRKMYAQIERELSLLALVNKELITLAADLQEKVTGGAILIKGLRNINTRVAALKDEAMLNNKELILDNTRLRTRVMDLKDTIEITKRLTE